MPSSFAVRSALLKNSDGTVDTCNALFHQENVGVLEYTGIRSRPKVITTKPLGIELDSTSLKFTYAQSNN